jgi:hypothetical protein
VYGYTGGTGKLSMGWRQSRRGWIRIAAIAIIICLIVLLVPHPQTTDSSVFALITLLIISLSPSPGLLSRLAYLNLDPIPDAPALPPTFQRPPPFRLR